MTGQGRRTALSPRLLLRRLIPRDPWGLHERCRLGRRAAGAFVPLHRLTLRALARAAYDARDGSDGSATRSRGAWLDRCVERALRELLEEQWTEEDLGTPLDPLRDAPFYCLFSRATGVQLRRARPVCVSLNALPRATRRAFFAVRFLRKSRNRYVAEGHGPPERVARLLCEARRAVRRTLDERGGEALGY